MDRENLNIEIALLVSLLLHAFAFGSWQYRTTLMKLPGLAFLPKLVRVMHLPQTTAAPQAQTITFVEVDEPRTKQQREEEKQAQRFMETDASQVTGEKPKNAKYYSDKSTVAANPNNPTGKEGDTPYLNGKETRVMNSVDVPTPSGVAAPVLTPPGAPGSPGKPAPPTAAPPTPQSKLSAGTPSQPQEIPPLGVKMVDEQKLAMAPKPSDQPEIATGADVPVRAFEEADMMGQAGAPAVAGAPGVPGREIVTRKAHLTVAGVSRTGVAAFNVEESPFGAYDKKIIKAVQSRWFALIDHYGIYESAATVTVHFELLDDGQVKDVNTTSVEGKSILSLFCEKAIIESGPFDPLPDNLRALVGKEPREASFTFYY